MTPASFRVLALIALGLAPASGAASTLMSIGEPGALAGFPGDTLVYTASLRNLSLSTIFINSDTAVLNGPADLRINDLFLDNAPLFLLQGETSDPFVWFTVDIPPRTTDLRDTPYSGALTIVGGVDGFDQTIAGEALFTVTILSSAPEVSPAWTLAWGLTMLFILKFSRRSNNRS